MWCGAPLSGAHWFWGQACYIARDAACRGAAHHHLQEIVEQLTEISSHATACVTAPGIAEDIPTCPITRSSISATCSLLLMRLLASSPCCVHAQTPSLSSCTSIWTTEPFLKRLINLHRSASEGTHLTLLLMLMLTLLHLSLSTHATPTGPRRGAADHGPEDRVFSQTPQKEQAGCRRRCWRRCCRRSRRHVRQRQDLPAAISGCDGVQGAGEAVWAGSRGPRGVQDAAAGSDTCHRFRRMMGAAEEPWYYQQAECNPTIAACEEHRSILAATL